MLNRERCKTEGRHTLLAFYSHYTNIDDTTLTLTKLALY
jgi:hypothetical protein